MHNGATRKYWVKDVLIELNEMPSPHPQLPSRKLLRVIQELMDEANFRTCDVRYAAVDELNQTLTREGLEAFIADNGQCVVRQCDGGISTSTLELPTRTWSKEEEERREVFAAFLENASEDQFTEELLVPIFERLGFIRVSATGHKDKALEYGKDLWMKFQLPTHHFIYFGAQVKLGKLHAAAGKKNRNIATVLNQIKMMLGHPIWDPETNRKHLLDHVFIIAAGEITKQAKNYLGERLDKKSRRHIIFMDCDDVLDVAVRSKIPLPHEYGKAVEPSFDMDDIPF